MRYCGENWDRLSDEQLAETEEQYYTVFLAACERVGVSADIADLLGWCVTPDGTFFGYMGDDMQRRDDFVVMTCERQALR